MADYIKDLPISVDTSVQSMNASISGTIAFNQGDLNSGELQLSVTHKSIAMDLTGAQIKVGFKKPDGTLVFQDGTTGVTVTNAANGQLNVLLRTQTLAVKGTIYGQVAVTFPDVGGDHMKDKVFVTNQFAFNINESLMSDQALVSNNDFQVFAALTVLQDLVPIHTDLLNLGTTVASHTTTIGSAILKTTAQDLKGAINENHDQIGILNRRIALNIATLKQANFVEGDYVRTLGYYGWNDGGGAEYYIQNNADPDDGGSTIVLNNGLRAKLVPKEIINVKWFGAKGDDINDDTAALQPAINYAETTKKPLFWAPGVYKVTNTLYLPAQIKMFGLDTPVGLLATFSPTTKIKAYVTATFKALFKPKYPSGNFTNIQLDVSQLSFFASTTRLDSSCFEGFALQTTKIIQNCFANWGIVIHSTVNAVSIIEKNIFLNVAVSVLKSRDIAAAPTLVDSFIRENYFNGSTMVTNCVLLDIATMATSTISDNYFDFAYMGVWINTGATICNTIYNNIFDYCYRGVYATSSNALSITANKSSHCKKSYFTTYWIAGSLMETSNVSAMTNNDWCGVYVASLVNNLLISGNQGTLCDRHINLLLNGNNNIITKNNFVEDGTTSNVTYLSDNTTGGVSSTNITIDELNYTKVSSLPSATLLVSNCVTFDGHILNYNSKIVRNDNGTWKDMMGAVAS